MSISDIPEQPAFLAVLIAAIVAAVVYGTSSTGTGQALALGLAVLVGYMLPTIVAKARNVPSVGSVLVVNVFLGWTFIGWVVALAMAARTVQPSGSRPPA
jgi:T4 superinfection immunity protein